MNETRKQSFGQFLAKCRIEKELTQRQLADKLYVEESTVSKWEMDKRRPGLELVIKLSEILGVTESELLNASVDNFRIKEKKQARRYRIISSTYNLFQLITFGIALLSCFIVNLAVSHNLSWFFIVLASLIFVSVHTLAPQFIKKYKLLIIPGLSMLSLFVLLLTCAIYTNGWWFVIPFAALLLAYTIVFLPIIIAKYNVPSLFRKHSAITVLLITIILIFVLLVVIDLYATFAESKTFGWSFKVGLPIFLFWAIPVLLTLSISIYVKINGFLKAAIIIPIWFAAQIVFNFLLKGLKIETDTQGFFWNANLAKWNTGALIEANCYSIVSMVALAFVLTFAIIGIRRAVNQKAK